MSEIPFHLTRMGQRFYEHTAPALVEQLRRLNQNLERLIATQHTTNPRPQEGHDHGPYHEEERRPDHDRDRGPEEGAQAADA